VVGLKNRENNPVTMMGLRFVGCLTVRAIDPSTIEDTGLAATLPMGALLVNDFRGKVNGRVIVIQMRFECLPYRLGINDADVIGILRNQQPG
jgi:hypothetical protein